jgi:hypothetical protein
VPHFTAAASILPIQNLETSGAPLLGLKPGLITCNSLSVKRHSCNRHISLAFGVPCIALQCLGAGLRMWHKEAKHEAPWHPGSPRFLSGSHWPPTDRRRGPLVGSHCYPYCVTSWGAPLHSPLILARLQGTAWLVGICGVQTTTFNITRHPDSRTTKINLLLAILQESHRRGLLGDRSGLTWKYSCSSQTRGRGLAYLEQPTPGTNNRCGPDFCSPPPCHPETDLCSEDSSAFSNTERHNTFPASTQQPAGHSQSPHFDGSRSRSYLQH